MKKYIDKIRAMFRKHSCVHDYELLGWHKCHADDYEAGPQVESKYECRKCGKTKFNYAFGKRAIKFMGNMGSFRQCINEPTGRFKNEN